MKKIIKDNETLIKVLFIISMVLCISGYVSSPVALVGGFLFSYFLGHPFLSLNSKAVNWLLKIAVVGLGFGMNLKETLAAGQDGFILTVFSISITLILGYFLGRLLKMNRKSSHLISSGTAICGGSAIAAVAPVINASEKDISISLGVIFLLNSIALIVFPPLGHLFGLSQHQFGLWCAIAIHDTSSVVGAAYTFGEEALKVATTVKLARALWIIPLSILSVFLFKGKGKSVKIPYFIFLFILAIIMNSYLAIPSVITGSITSISKSLLVLTLFLIGAGLSLDKIKSAGWKPMILGVSLWIFISISSILVIIFL
ncbi:putative membrane protein [Aequorivita sublithincola DSM 14238]|uniref:Putative membrane protein n=1 Tax=Aequorivita sublithincola (strain DSM 14238 / LMG 21431 / ACAM 643 / 9-3) TaxID=746697 RepID=I3YRK0_AEQSU|nr:putative sulfate exporter family transporter [Aequorivita sublithincola]AFL79618.1 putative membrane protein [Aequorivita sublithincola DSM 14238]